MERGLLVRLEKRTKSPRSLVSHSVVLDRNILKSASLCKLKASLEAKFLYEV